ncbi:hypothetical protein E2C01_021807 [Portunus trituberculatus]|uniref:Uncharacterized protein n=1 Tax=Portunus trituberculatus TaxID=210409 RepID=A0A5B7E5B9_PORTR|nr:hypothetical protein [Portunus trituberculatus]
MTDDDGGRNISFEKFAVLLTSATSVMMMMIVLVGSDEEDGGAGLESVAKCVVRWRGVWHEEASANTHDTVLTGLSATTLRHVVYPVAMESRTQASVFFVYSSSVDLTASTILFL